MRRPLLILLAIVAVVAVLGYLAYGFDLAGMIVRMHTPPQH